MNRVGAKGNIVIDRRIRERLGIQPGWDVIQTLNAAGDVVLHFLPPAEPGSAFGCLRPGGDTSWLATGEALEQEMREAAFEAAGLSTRVMVGDK